MKKVLMLIAATLALIMLLPLASFAAKDDGGLPFSDVKSWEWYYRDVKRAFETKLMNGTSKTEFDPNGSLTRGMCATIIYRAANEPDVKAASTFEDVAADAYYAKAVAWAQDEEIVKGRTDTSFDPNGKITRADFSTMLYRYSDAEDLALPESREGDPADVSSIPEYAAEAVGTMYRAEVVNGRENGEFDPGARITRAEASAMLTRFLDAATVEETDEETLNIGFFGDSATINIGMIAQFEAIAEGKNVNCVQLSKEGCSPEQILAEWTTLLEYESNREKIASLDMIVIAAVNTNPKYGRSIIQGDDYWVWQPDAGYNAPEITEETTGDALAAAFMTNGHNGPYVPVLPKIKALFGEDKDYYFFTWNDSDQYKVGTEGDTIAAIKAGFESWGFTLVSTLGNSHWAVADLDYDAESSAAFDGYCSALYVYNAIFGEDVVGQNYGLVTSAEIPGDTAEEDAAYVAALQNGIKTVIEDPLGALRTAQHDGTFGDWATKVLNDLISPDVIPGDTPEAKAAYMDVLKDIVYDLCERMGFDPADFIIG